jgi:hypothetical protein
MTSPANDHQRVILAETRIPPAALGALRERFADIVAENVHLDGATRLEWLAERPAAKGAAALCNHEFEPRQLEAVLDVERRRGPLGVLFDANPSARTAILSHPNGGAAVHAAVSHSDVDPVSLVEHLSHVGVPQRIRVLATCDLRVDDATVASVLATCERQRLPRATQEQASMLVHQRPGLTAALRALGHPGVAQEAVATSPWVTLDDMAIILSAPQSALGHLQLEGLFGDNPWIPFGEETAALLSTERGRRHLEDRERLGHVFTSRPTEVGYDEVLRMWNRQSTPKKESSLTPLQALVATSPNLGSMAKMVAARLRDSRLAVQSLPSWVYQRALRTFAENHPGHIDDVLARMDTFAGTGDDSSAPAELPGRRLALEDVAVGRIHLVWPATRRLVLEQFSSALGDDPDVWVAAALLATDPSMTFAELVELATCVNDVDVDAA